MTTTLSHEHVLLSPIPILWVSYFSAVQAVVGIVTEESNDYFATRYWAQKKVTVILLLVTLP
jgi:hypothetical protein